ncbi:UBC-like protein [Aspergillus egyptiacus]|nr:UBC-like protein [Aspergillus egyptiacus]
MVSKLRRLIADHAALHEELPPNYLFPPEDAQSDDMTQLTALLAGPQGTPYSQGLWRLHLKMPEDYPKSPPKATFKTRIWHPNVEESTGAVCVDTLKRDWKSTLTLKDVLITISCLLIYPNPDSALNSTAGALLQENYDAFARQAKLMTSIHAPVPSDLRNEVMEAKMRGEESGTTVPEQEDTARALRSRKGKTVQSVTMKKRPTRMGSATPQPPDPENIRTHERPDQSHDHLHQQAISDDENENDNPASSSKENDPSLSPSPVKFAPPLSPRKNAHGKRPLSVLTPSTSIDADPFTPDLEDMNIDTTESNTMTASERNIAANIASSTRDSPTRCLSPQRKSPKLSSLVNRGLNTARPREDSDLKIFEDPPDKENVASSSSSLDSLVRGINRLPSKSQNPTYPPAILTSTSSASNPSGSTRYVKPGAGTRKVSSLGTKKAKPRIGIRRL